MRCAEVGQSNARMAGLRDHRVVSRRSGLAGVWKWRNPAESSRIRIGCVPACASGFGWLTGTIVRTRPAARDLGMVAKGWAAGVIHRLRQPASRYAANVVRHWAWNRPPVCWQPSRMPFRSLGFSRKPCAQPLGSRRAAFVDSQSERTYDDMSASIFALVFPPERRFRERRLRERLGGGRF